MTVQILFEIIYCSPALKSRSVLRAAPRVLRLLYNRNVSLCTVTFGEKVLTLAKSCGSEVRGYGSLKSLCMLLFC